MQPNTMLVLEFLRLCVPANTHKPERESIGLVREDEKMAKPVRLRSAFPAIWVILLTVACIASAAPVTMTYGVFDVVFYNNGDTDGQITSQGNWTAEQMLDVSASIQTWQGNIANIPGRQIQMHAFWNELDSYSPTVLGGSGSARIADGTTMWNLGEYVWKEGLNPGYTSFGYDTVIQYDITAAGFSWNFGAGPAASGQIDFRSVVTHEIGHSLGWSSSYDNDYDDWGWLSNTYGYQGLTAWDKNLVDGAGNRAMNNGSGAPGNFNETDNPVYFDGSSASAVNGGSVEIYAPNPFKPGSSLSHLDESALGGLLMSPSVALGQNIRSVSDLEWAMMDDMGWTLVPEPATITLFVLGFAVLRSRCKS